MKWEAERSCESLFPKSAAIVWLGRKRSVKGDGQDWVEGVMKIKWERHEVKVEDLFRCYSAISASQEIEMGIT